MERLPSGDYSGGILVQERVVPSRAVMKTAMAPNRVKGLVHSMVWEEEYAKRVFDWPCLGLDQEHEVYETPHQIPIHNGWTWWGD